MPRRSSARAVSSYLVFAEACVAAGAASAVVCLGGAFAWSLWPLVGFSAAALALAAIGAHRHGHGIRVSLLAWVFVAAAAVIALQLVPLPSGLLSWVSPGAAEARAFALAPLGLSSGGPVSLDPPSTWRELAKHLSYLALLLATSQVVRVRKEPRRVLRVVAWLGVAVATTGVLHLLFQGRSLFGLYSFRGSPTVVTFLANPNHLAAFLSVAASCAAGLAFLQRSRTRAWLWGLGYVLMGFVLVLSLSRGGILFFVVSQVLLAFLLWRWRPEPEGSLAGAGASRPRRGWEPRGTAFAWLLGGVLVVASIGAYLALDALEREWKTVDSVEDAWRAKPYLWPHFWAAAAEYPVLGMGRGAFEAAFTRYQSFAPGVVFTHPENLLLQWVAELGVVPSLALLGLGAFALFGSGRGRKHDLFDAVVVAALLGAGLHDLFDFALALPATAVAVVILLPLLSREGEASEQLRSGFRISPVGGGALAAGVLVLGAIGAGIGSRTLEADEKVLAEKLSSGASPGEALAAALPLMDRHPSDYLLHGMLAARWSSGSGADPRQALAFANRALFLRPLDPDAHLAAARALLRLGRRQQAMLEYRLAVPAGGWRVFDESMRMARTVDELWQAAPLEPEAVRVFASKLWGAGRREEAVALLARARGEPEVGSGAAASPLWTLAASYALALGHKDEALALADEAVRLAPSLPEATLVQARVLAARGDRPAAVERLRAALRQHLGHFALSVALAETLHAGGQRDEARDALRQLTPFVSKPHERAQLFATEGNLLRNEGKLHKALERYESAARISPKSAHYQFMIARLCEALSRPVDALRAVNEGVRLVGRESPAETEWIARLREKEQALEKLRLEKQLLRVEDLEE